MEVHEIKTAQDLLTFVQDHVKDRELLTWFEDVGVKLNQIISASGAPIEVSITEGGIPATRQGEATPVVLRAIQYTYMIAEDFNPGWTFVFGEGDDANTIIDIVSRNPDEPFQRAPRKPLVH